MERITDFHHCLSGSISRNFVDKIVRSVLNHPDDFKMLYSLITTSETKISWRAAWACEKLCKERPEWFIPLYNELSESAQSCQHEGTKRLLLSVIYHLPIPEKLPICLLDFCIEKMLDPEESIAVQSLCIKIAFEIACQQPDLLYELKLYLENTNTEYYSTAVKSTVRIILKKISQMKSEKKDRICSQKN